MNTKRVIQRIAEFVVAAITIGALLAGCGWMSSSSGGSTVGGAGGGGGVVSGAVILGPVSGGTATIWALDSAGAHMGSTPIGSAVVSASGVFTVTLSSTPSGPISIEVSGGSYTSEADGSHITVTTTVHSLLSSLSAIGSAGVAVTPLTDMSYAHAVAHAASGLSVSIPLANSFISTTFGLGGNPDAIMPDFTAAAVNAGARGGRYAVALVALENLIKSLASSAGISTREDVYSALSADYSDGRADGEDAHGRVHIVPSGEGASAVLPPTALGSDFSTALGNVASGVFTGGDATAGIISDADTIGLGVASNVPPSVSTASGGGASSSGAISYATILGRQYLFVAARRSGVRKVDITDPASAVEVTAPAWNGAALSGDAGFGGQAIGGAMVLSTQTNGLVVLAFAYGAKHIAVLNSDTGNILYEGNLPIAAGSTIEFSGGSAFIAGGIPDPGKGAWLATADGYMYLDINATLATGTPVMGSTIFPVAAGSAYGINALAENLGGDIAHNLLFTPNYSGLNLQIVANQPGGLSKGIYKLDSSVPGAMSFLSGNMDGGSVDTGWGIGIVSYEDTSSIGLVNLNGISASAVASGATIGTFLTPSTNGTVSVFVAPMSFSGTAVDSATHQVFGMAGYSTSIFVGQLQNPASAASGSWLGMTDWVAYNLSSYNEAHDPHANATVFNNLTGKTFAYLLSGDPVPDGVMQIDVSGLLGMARAGGSGDALHQPATNPQAGGGPITKILLP